MALHTNPILTVHRKNGRSLCLRYETPESALKKSKLTASNILMKR